MDVVLLFLSVLWLGQAALVVAQMSYLLGQLGRPPTPKVQAYRPRAAVIVPFKGAEPGLEQHVQGLFEQDYPDYHLLLVAESADDPAWAVLEAARARHGPDRATLLATGQAPPDQGQKTHNQLCALRHLHERGMDEQVWVFADSDAAPGPNWLGDLIGPLVKRRRVASTGYRWLVPTPGEDGRISIWSHLASVMNGSVACLLGRRMFNQAWGGSMAVRVDNARQGRLEERLKGAITDDYPVTLMARDLGGRVHFSPRCLVASPAAFTWGSLRNFAFRQYLITKVYRPGLYTLALLGPGIYFIGAAGAWAWVILWWLGHSAWGAHGFYAIGGVLACNQVRATLRARVVGRAFGPKLVEQLRVPLLIDRWLTPLWLLLHWFLMWQAFGAREMVWRGTRYRVNGPREVRRMDDA